MQGKEWSGVVLFQFNQPFISKDFTITLKDFILLDLGEPGYTNFMLNEYFLAKGDEKGLFNSKGELLSYGLLHSHHNMNVYFSPTDKSTFHSMSEDFSVFVSIVVNNDLEMYGQAGSLSRAKVTKEIIYSETNGVENSFSHADEDKILLNKNLEFEIDYGFDVKEYDDKIAELKKANAQLKYEYYGYGAGYQQDMFKNSQETWWEKQQKEVEEFRKKSQSQNNKVKKSQSKSRNSKNKQNEPMVRPLELGNTTIDSAPLLSRIIITAINGIPVATALRYFIKAHGDVVDNGLDSMDETIVKRIQEVVAKESAFQTVSDVDIFLLDSMEFLEAIATKEKSLDDVCAFFIELFGGIYNQTSDLFLTTGTQEYLI